ncbi:MAG TPA: TetR family transcriptional regulator, partial [Acidimicrobiales bacterium]|nr:TetR family transcriptional regulator [Acidimicrobiales bacterium]
MPKIVDHEARRGEIVRAAWRIIVRDGFDAATMAAIAAEAGFANGALKPYFATKHDLLVAAFEHLYDQTTRRVA